MRELEPFDLGAHLDDVEERGVVEGIIVHIDERRGQVDFQVHSDTTPDSFVVPNSIAACLHSLSLGDHITDRLYETDTHIDRIPVEQRRRLRVGARIHLHRYDFTDQTRFGHEETYCISEPLSPDELDRYTEETKRRLRLSTEKRLAELENEAAVKLSNMEIVSPDEPFFVFDGMQVDENGKISLPDRLLLAGEGRTPLIIQTFANRIDPSIPEVCWAFNPIREFHYVDLFPFSEDPTKPPGDINEGEFITIHMFGGNETEFPSDFSEQGIQLIINNKVWSCKPERWEWTEAQGQPGTQPLDWRHFYPPEPVGSLLRVTRPNDKPINTGTGTRIVLPWNPALLQEIQMVVPSLHDSRRKRS